MVVFRSMMTSNLEVDMRMEVRAATPRGFGLNRTATRSAGPELLGRGRAALERAVAGEGRRHLPGPAPADGERCRIAAARGTDFHVHPLDPRVHARRRGPDAALPGARGRVGEKAGQLAGCSKPVWPAAVALRLQHERESRLHP